MAVSRESRTPSRRGRGVHERDLLRSSQRGGVLIHPPPRDKPGPTTIGGCGRVGGGGGRGGGGGGGGQWFTVRWLERRSGCGGREGPGCGGRGPGCVNGTSLGGGGGRGG